MVLTSVNLGAIGYLRILVEKDCQDQVLAGNARKFMTWD